MQIIARTHCANEHYTADCDYVTIHLTPALAKAILARIAVTELDRRNDQAFFEARYWNSAATYFAAPEDGLSLSELLETIGDDEWKTTETDIEIGDDIYQRTEGDTLVISPGFHPENDPDVYFEARPKHCDFTVSSPYIPLALIKAAAGCSTYKPTYPDGRTDSEDPE